MVRKKTKRNEQEMLRNLTRGTIDPVLSKLRASRFHPSQMEKLLKDIRKSEAA